MIAVFRTDSSIQIGTGHVMRCLALADVLQKKGAQVHFISRDLEGNIAPLVREKGFKLSLLPKMKIENLNLGPVNGSYSHWLVADSSRDVEDTTKVLEDVSQKPDWLIVDHYGIDSKWCRVLRSKVKKIFIIDDIGEASKECDLLLNQNFSMENQYVDLVGGETGLLLGPRYAILRDEFAEKRKTLKRSYGQISKVLVSFGGIDLENMTSQVLEILSTQLNKSVEVHVVLSRSAPHLEKVQSLVARSFNFKFHVDVKQMSALLAQCDLAVGAPGVSAYERCCLGLPSILVSLAPNQEPVGSGLAEAKTCFYLGRAKEVSTSQWKESLNGVLNNPMLLQSMGKKSMALVDGRGAERVALRILNNEGARK